VDTDKVKVKSTVAKSADALSVIGGMADQRLALSD
jgi:hypothetical protein